MQHAVFLFFILFIVCQVFVLGCGIEILNMYDSSEWLTHVKICPVFGVLSASVKILYHCVCVCVCVRLKLRSSGVLIVGLSV